MSKKNNLLSKLKYNKSGSMSTEIILGTLIVIILISFAIDLILISHKLMVLSTTSTYLSRTVGLQGGLLSNPPSGFEGGGNGYQRKATVINNINRVFKAAGIRTTEWFAKINGNDILGENKVDEGFAIKTELTINFSWKLLSNFIPGNLNQSVTSKRVVISEFKERTEGIKGE